MAEATVWRAKLMVINRRELFVGLVFQIISMKYSLCRKIYENNTIFGLLIKLNRPPFDGE